MIELFSVSNLSRMNRNGLSVDELKSKIKVEQARRSREASSSVPSPPFSNVSNLSNRPSTQGTFSTNVRKDSSPIKVRNSSSAVLAETNFRGQPLSSILNLQRIMSMPHTSAQISALWTAYHLSRSGGTGRGYVCASVPLDLYHKMANVAERYSTFVVPVPHVKNAAESKADEGETTSYEFYFLQWDFHDVPPVPSATDDPFARPTPVVHSADANPKRSTILFTPLQEYKIRASFATPYFVITHYTDLAQSHGVVLLRGEITPASAGGGNGVDGRYMLSQEDAQLLSIAVQKFYLWDGRGEDQERGEKLLQCFHETPGRFKWEELLKHSTSLVG